MTDTNSTAVTQAVNPVPDSFTRLRPATLNELAIQLLGWAENTKFESSNATFDAVTGTISFDHSFRLNAPANGATLDSKTVIFASSDPLRWISISREGGTPHGRKSRLFEWTTTGWQELQDTSFTNERQERQESLVAFPSKYYFKIILDSVVGCERHILVIQSNATTTLEFFAPRSFPGFRAEYPIDFRLYDDDQQSVLYIDNGPTGNNGAAGHPLHIELHNRSGRDITFSPVIEPSPSPTNHHLELQFRPGTLSPNTLAALGAEKVEITEESWGSETPDPALLNWGLRVSEPKSGEPVSLYLLRTGAAKVLGDDERCVLSLAPMAADARQGARGAQVTLRFKQLFYAKPEQSPVVGERTRQLYIGHFGRRDLPLHVGFIGPQSNRIHSDGSESTLRLRITNTHPRSVIGSRPDWKPTFILKFDYGDQSWALCSAGDANEKINVYQKWPGVAHQDETADVDDVPKFTRGENGNPEWRIEFPPETEKGLKPGEHVEVRISINGISHPHSGNTNLYVDYENIPGYGEGRIICTVDRSPLIFTDAGVEIHGGIEGQSNNHPTVYVKQQGAAPAILTDGDLTVQGDLEIQGNLRSSKGWREIRMQDTPWFVKGKHVQWIGFVRSGYISDFTPGPIHCYRDAQGIVHLRGLVVLELAKIREHEKQGLEHIRLRLGELPEDCRSVDTTCAHLSGNGCDVFKKNVTLHTSHNSATPIALVIKNESICLTLDTPINNPKGIWFSLDSISFPALVAN